MHFTREPTVETVITPREGCKLVVRSSRGGGCEEFFVDAIEVVVFGDSCFFRSLEKPKCFLLPVSDYEVVEVRETRMVLKAAMATEKAPARKPRAKAEPKPKPKAQPPAEEEGPVEEKRERRRQRRRKAVESDSEATSEEATPELSEPKAPAANAPSEKEPPAKEPPVEGPPKTLIPPPTELISRPMESSAKEKSAETPELVPPAAQEEGGFRLFRRFRGTEETPPSEDS